MVENTNRVYRLGDALSNTAFRGEVNDVNQIWRARRGDPPSGAIAVRHMSGKILRDLIWTGAVAPLVSERVTSLLAGASLSGWSTFPVKLFDAGGQEINGYVGLAITGRCNWIGFDRREEASIFRPNRSGGQTRYFRGLKYDEQSWDGSDFYGRRAKNRMGSGYRTRPKNIHSCEDH